jgi:hypothetical protein
MFSLLQPALVDFRPPVQSDHSRGAGPASRRTIRARPAATLGTRSRDAARRRGSPDAPACRAGSRSGDRRCRGPGACALERRANRASAPPLRARARTPNTAMHSHEQNVVTYTFNFDSRRARSSDAERDDYLTPAICRIMPSLFVRMYSSPSLSSAKRMSTRPRPDTAAPPGSASPPPRARNDASTSRRRPASIS